MKRLKRFLGVIISTLLIVNYTVPQAANINNKSSDSTSNVIEIPLTWTRNSMDTVNSIYSERNNSYHINQASYINKIFDNNNKLIDPNNISDIRGDKIITGKILRTDYILDDNDQRTYTMDYKTLEKWFEKGNISGVEPYPLQNKLEWNGVNGTAQRWDESTEDDYKTQDWNLFRGIVDLNNAKDSNGNSIKVNPNDYEFYLGSPNDHAMFIGANDFISVFVDEMATNINYTTTQQRGAAAKTIKYIQGNGVEEAVTYKQEYHGKNGSGMSRPHYNCIATTLPYYNNIIDGWHVDLNDFAQDAAGNTVLGDVTDIIRKNGFGSKHMVDLLTSEWCNWGGVTKVSLYAVKKPTLNIQKDAYIKAKDLGGKEIASKDIASRDKNSGEITLNTNNNTPKVPSSVPIYYRFILSNTSDTEIDNIEVNDIDLNEAYNQTNINNKGSSLKITDDKGKKTDLKKLKPHSSILLQDEDHLKYIEKSDNYSELSKTIKNTVEATGQYFFNQLNIKAKDTVNIQESEPKINMTVNKYLDMVIRDGKKLNIDNNPSLIKGDYVRFKISIKNNTVNGEKGVNVDKVSLDDILNGYSGTKNIYNKKDWDFLINDNGVAKSLGKEITIPKNRTLDIYTDWKLESNDLTKGINTAKISINGTPIDESTVEFPIKARMGTINVTKKVSNYNELNDEDKKTVDGQLFTINLKGEDGSIQSIALNNGQTGQFKGIKYGVKYTISESIPSEYELSSIVDNKVTDLDKDSKTVTFKMDESADNSNAEILNKKYDGKWFDWVGNKINDLKTSLNI